MTVFLELPFFFFFCIFSNSCLAGSIPNPYFNTSRPVTVQVQKCAWTVNCNCLSVLVEKNCNCPTVLVEKNCKCAFDTVQRTKKNCYYGHKFNGASVEARASNLIYQLRYCFFRSCSILTAHTPFISWDSFAFLARSVIRCTSYVRSAAPVQTDQGYFTSFCTFSSSSCLMMRLWIALEILWISLLNPAVFSLSR